VTQGTIKKVIQFFLDKIIPPLLVALLSPIVVGITSQIITGDWTRCFSTKLLIIWGASIIALIIAFAIYKRIKHLREENSVPRSYVITTSTWGWIDIGSYNYADVVWKIRIPAPSPLKNFRLSEISPYDITVDVPPRCPNCGTEIEQSRRFWGGYIWKCPRGDFKKINRDSYSRESERVEKLVRSDWEKFINRRF
jgi:hypothetical protein